MLVSLKHRVPYHPKSVESRLKRCALASAVGDEDPAGPLDLAMTCDGLRWLAMADVFRG